MRHIIAILFTFTLSNSYAQSNNLELAKELLNKKDYKNAKIEIDKVDKDSDSAIQLKNNWTRLRIYFGLLKEYSQTKNIDSIEFEKQLLYVYHLLKLTKNRIGMVFELQNTAQVHINVTYNYIQSNKLNEAQRLLKISDTCYQWYEYDKSPKSKVMMNAFDHYFTFYKSWILFKTNNFTKAAETIETIDYSENLKKDAEYHDYRIELYNKTNANKLSFVLWESTLYFPKNIKYYKLYFENQINEGYSYPNSFFNIAEKAAINNFPDSLLIYEKILTYYLKADKDDLYYYTSLTKCLEIVEIALKKFPQNNSLKYKKMIALMNKTQQSIESYNKSKNDEDVKDSFLLDLKQTKEYYNLLKDNQSFIKSLSKEELANFNSFKNNLN